MQCVILAGGLATRMRPHTTKTPKSMLVVAERPFVDWQLEKIAAAGFTDVVLCVAFLGEQIEAHVGSGERYGLRVRYSYEGATLLGTAGALRAALPLFAPTFLVTYGDSWLPFDYAAPLRHLEAHPDCDGVMSVFKNDGAWDASNVKTDGAWVLAYAKGTSDRAYDHIDYGALALRREAVAAIPEGQVIALDALQQTWAEKHRLRALPVEDRFFEIGSPQGMADTDAKLRAMSGREGSP
jgi:NDP-sugar pyrophosphorylase family protein